jgi:hypothetical protein
MLTSAQVTSPMSAAVHEHEQVLTRSVELTARWDALGETRARLTLPVARTATLRFKRRYTFEEALALWTRDATAPATPEELHRLGNAYRQLALAGVRGAREQAIDLLTRYLQRNPAGHTDEVVHALDELERLEFRPR